MNAAISEAKRLSDQLVFVSPGTPHETAEWIDAARATMRELVERLEQAEQALERVEPLLDAQFDGHTNTAEFMEKAGKLNDALNIVREALAAQREKE